MASTWRGRINVTQMTTTENRQMDGSRVSYSRAQSDVDAVFRALQAQVHILGSADEIARRDVQSAAADPSEWLHQQILLLRLPSEHRQAAAVAESALAVAAFHGKAEALQEILDTVNVESEAGDTNGDAAYLMACMAGHTECMQLLTAAGCDTTAKVNGSTGLMLAARQGKAEALQAILEAGNADLEARAPDGNTAYLMACMDGHAE